MRTSPAMRALPHASALLFLASTTMACARTAPRTSEAPRASAEAPMTFEVAMLADEVDAYPGAPSHSPFNSEQITLGRTPEDQPIRVSHHYVSFEAGEDESPTLAIAVRGEGVLPTTPLPEHVRLVFQPLWERSGPAKGAKSFRTHVAAKETIATRADVVRATLEDQPRFELDLEMAARGRRDPTRVRIELSEAANARYAALAQASRGKRVAAIVRGLVEDVWTLRPDALPPLVVTPRAASDAEQTRRANAWVRDLSR